MGKSKSDFKFELDKEVYIDVTEDVNLFPVYTSCSYGMFKGKTPIRVKQSGHYVENVDEYGTPVSGYGLWLDKNVQVERLNKKGKFVRDDTLQEAFYNECYNRYYNQDDFAYDFAVYGFENEALSKRYDKLIYRDDDGNRNPIKNLENAILYKDERSETHAYYSSNFGHSTGAYFLKELDGHRPIKGIEKGFENFKTSHSLPLPSKKDVSLQSKKNGKENKTNKTNKKNKIKEENQDLSL